jgi:MoxR-like ATPase
LISISNKNADLYTNNRRSYYGRTRKVIVGQDAVIEQILVAVLAEGHALLEGVPGTAKTLTVKTLARIVGADFSRIQFTPDLMPSDITGTNVFNMQNSDFLCGKVRFYRHFISRRNQPHAAENASRAA